jgi:hypothetical protein
MARDWRDEERLQQLAARKATDEAKRDPLLEQCVIAYINNVKEYGPRRWDEFRTAWMKDALNRPAPEAAS